MNEGRTYGGEQTRKCTCMRMDGTGLLSRAVVIGEPFDQVSQPASHNKLAGGIMSFRFLAFYFLKGPRRGGVACAVRMQAGAGVWAPYRM